MNVARMCMVVGVSGLFMVQAEVHAMDQKAPNKAKKSTRELVMEYLPYVGYAGTVLGICNTWRYNRKEDHFREALGIVIPAQKVFFSNLKIINNNANNPQYAVIPYGNDSKRDGIMLVQELVTTIMMVATGKCNLIEASKHLQSDLRDAS